MDTKLTEKMQAWLNAEPEDRSLEEGVVMVLQLTRNRFLADNIKRRKDMKMLEYQLQKYLKQRLNTVTHQEVEEMKKQAAKIAEDRHLDAKRKTPKSLPEEWKKGKREDHDSLPEEMQALYKENLNLLRRMRECHMQARRLAKIQQPCTDCDVYPFVKELIELDKKYRDNWARYDSYGREQADDK